MKKQSDQHSKEFYERALKDLSDPFAKSYYAGLKGMHEDSKEKPKADYATLYGFQKEDGADLILSAHPKTIQLADAMGKGGVVENQLEQHNHNVGVALSMPTGNFTGRFASVISELTKLASEADKKNKSKIADQIDLYIQKIINRS